MTHEEQVRLLEDIRNEEFSTNEVLTRVVLALPVTDAPLVAETTVPPPSSDELREAAHDVCSAGDLVLYVIAKTSDGNESRPLTNAQCFLDLKDAIARVRAALGKGKP